MSICRFNAEYYGLFRLPRTNEKVIAFIVKKDYQDLAAITDSDFKGRLRKHRGAVQITIDKEKKVRTKDQNALLWSLLGIMADTLHEPKEDLYYKMLEKYGATTFLSAPTDSLPILQKVFKIVQIIDTAATATGKVSTFKCIMGSSENDTVQMGKLIDGILDDLSILDIPVSRAADIEYYYKEWKKQQTT